MPDFNNPIEKYNKQDRKLFGFLGKLGIAIDYILFSFGGVFWGSILALVLGAEGIPFYAYAIAGAFTGVALCKIDSLFRNKFGDELPTVPILLFLSLLILAAAYLFV